MKKNILALIILAVIATPALAEGAVKRYVGIGYGSARFGNTSASPNASVFRIVSGRQFTPMFAVEIDFSLFGDFSVNNGVSSSTVTGSSTQLASVGTFPISDDVDLIGKIGVSRNLAVGRGGATIAGHAGNSMSYNDVFFGFGAQYLIDSKVSLHALYYNYGKFENAASPIKATSVTLGVTYKY
jgi:OOP family OmpA-OmpF porin